MIFDSHAHYDDKAFDEDRKELLEKMSEAGISYIINVGASLASCQKTIEIMAEYPFVYGAIGVHPDEVGELNPDAMRWLKEQCLREKVLAVGEIGLDYYWDKSAHEIQKHWFREQLHLARELSLPVIIHSRDAAKDTLDVLKEENAEQIGGVIHCFSYGAEMALEYVKLGFHIGVGGVVTFQNGKKLKETVRRIPLDKILLETDCPYLAPVPYRGKRNSSLYIPHIAEEIAKIKEIPYEQVLSQTMENAKKVFGFKI